MCCSAREVSPQPDFLVLCSGSSSSAKAAPTQFPVASTALNVLVAWLRQQMQDCDIIVHLPTCSHWAPGKGQFLRASETIVTHYITSAGAVLVIIMIFMAVTSSGASEMLAVSSLFTFDIYRRYIKPKASVSNFHALVIL